jgi:hypothetical protein
MRSYLFVLLPLFAFIIWAVALLLFQIRLPGVSESDTTHFDVGCHCFPEFCLSRNFRTLPNGVLGNEAQNVIFRGSL